MLMDSHEDVSPSLRIDHAERQWRVETSLRQVMAKNGGRGQNSRHPNHSMSLPQYSLFVAKTLQYGSSEYYSRIPRIVVVVVTNACPHFQDVFVGLVLEFENFETNSFLEGMCSQVPIRSQSNRRFRPLERAERLRSKTVNDGRKRTRMIVVKVTITSHQNVLCVPQNHQETVQEALAGQEKRF